jgi:hypothetical protein
VQAERSSASTPPAGERDISAAAADICNHLAGLSSGQKLVLLPVMIDGAPYAEDVEQRLRARYALLSALNVAGYTPDDSEHIGAFEVPWPESPLEGNDAILDLTTLGGAGPKLWIPFEWFSADGLANHPGTGQRILMLWLDDDAFGVDPLTRLAQLLGALKEKVGTSNWSNVQVHLIGPAGSTTLQAMTTDPIISSPNDGFHRLRANISDSAISVNCAYATASNEFLVNPPAVVGSDRDLLLNFSNGSDQLQLQRTGGTDQELAQSILDELDRRRVRLSSGANETDKPSDYVAIITEWDTFYGRVFPRTLEACLHCRRQKGVDFGGAVKWLGLNEEPGVIRLNYLCGVDGAKAVESGEGQALATAGGANGAGSGSESAAEPQDGTAQFDYIRRMVQTLQDEDAELRRQKPPARIAAIGVVGSDVYDKLVVLRAFQYKFRDALFFTTDLDNRLSQQSELPWTRNLIVASQFGQSLAANYQDGIPPFRDTYQTALFESCLVALGKIDASAASGRRPQIFEIGRYGGVNLTPGDADKINPAREPTKFWGSAAETAIAAVMVFLIGVFVLAMTLKDWVCRVITLRRKAVLDQLSPEAKEGIERSQQAEMAQIWVLAVFFWGALLAFGWIAQIGFNDQTWFTRYSSGGGEPFSIVDGVSIWPSEFIRLCSSFLCLYFLVRSRHRLYRNSVHLADAYGLRVPRYPPVSTIFTRDKEAAGGDHKKGGKFHWLSIWWWEAQPSAASIDDVWEEYVEMASIRWRGRRTGILVAVYVAFAWGLFAWLPGTGLSAAPHPPVRGSWVDGWDFAFLTLNWVTTSVLIFFVMDAMRLCQGLSNRVFGEKVRWSQKSLEKFGKQMPLHKPDLAVWMDMEFIKDKASIVQQMIYYPAIVVFLNIAARLNVLDRWDWPLCLVLIYFVNAALAILVLILLRHTVGRAHQATIDKLNQSLLGHYARPSPEYAAQIKALIDGLPQGPTDKLLNFLQNPLLHALLIPTGGVGFVKLIEMLVVP